MRVLLHGNFRCLSSFSIVNRHLTAGLRAAGHAVTECPSDDPRAAYNDVAPADVYLFHGHPWEMRVGGGILNVFALNYEYLSADAALRAAIGEINAGFDLLLVPAPFLKPVVRAAGLRIPVEVLPWGFDPREFHRSTVAPPSLTTERLVFVYAGAVNPRKGVDRLLRAYRAEFGADDRVILVIKESTRHPSWESWAGELERSCDAAVNAPEVKWLYEKSASLAPYFAAAAAGVFPHRGEGFGLPILECLASGRPVIATRGTGPDAFCTRANSWPIRTRRVRRNGRVELEPDWNHLRVLMRMAYEGRAAAPDRKQLAESVGNWTWQRSTALLAGILERHFRRLPRQQRRARTTRQPAIAYGFHARGASSWKRLCAEFDDSLAARFSNYRARSWGERRAVGAVDVVLGQSEHCLDLIVRARRQNPGAVVIVHQESTVLGDRVAIVNRERRRCGVPPLAMSPMDLWRNRMENELADHFVVASSVARECFLAHGFPAARVHVIPYGVVRGPLHVRRRARTTRFLFVGTDPFRKGIRLLFAAWERAAPRDAELICCTDLEILRSKLLLGFLVRNPSIVVRPLLPPRAFRHVYAEIDCQVLPSLEDTFSVAIADGMGVGKPAIVSSATGVKDLITHGVNGHVVPAGSIDALAASLVALADDRAGLRVMGEAAHDTVKSYGWSRCRRAIADLVQAIWDQRA